jgi:hypothetical protein
MAGRVSVKQFTQQTLPSALAAYGGFDGIAVRHSSYEKAPLGRETNPHFHAGFTVPWHGDGDCA